MATVAGTNVTIGNGGSYTANAGDNRVVLFFVRFLEGGANLTITALDFGGTAATRIGGVMVDTGAGERPHVDLWRVNESDGIPAGSSTVTATFLEDAPTTVAIHAVTVQDANQTDFTVVDSDFSASATTLSASITSLDDSVVIAAMSLVHNASNTDVTPNWTGATESSDGTSGAPSQRYWSAYRDVTTGTTESIDPSWSVAVAGALFAVLVKNFSAGGGGSRLLLALMTE